MKNNKPYAELVKEAEKAVVAIKDPELRRVAFERVLDDLLSSGGASKTGKVRASKKAKRSANRGGTASKKKRGPKGHVRELISEGFFKKPKTIAEVKAELANRGHHIVRTSLSGPLQTLCQERLLRRSRAKTSNKSKTTTFNYSEW